MDIISGQPLFLLCFILSCYLNFTTAKSRRSPRQVSASPPGPPRLPIIGNIHLVGKNPHRSFTDLSKTYGPVMSLKLGCLNSVVIASRDAAREVLRTHDQILSGRYLNEAIRSNNNHDFSVAWLHPSSPRWRMLRKVSVTQLFSPQRIEATKAPRMKKMQELVNFFMSEREEAVDISRASFVTTLDIISNILFSVNLGSYNSKNSSVFQNLVTSVMDSIGNPDLANFFPFMRFLDLQGNCKKMTTDFSERLFQESVISSLDAAGKPDAANYFPFLGFLDLQGNRKAMKVSTERLFGVFRGFVDAKKAEKSLGNNSKDVSNRDFLDSLLVFTEGDEAELDYNDIDHILLDMFTAGTDTSSSTVEWAMTELLKNPKTMAKAQAEIDRVIGQNGIVEESDILELPYLQAVVKETFRLHPTVPLLIPRKAEADVEVLGFMVPKDTQVLVNVWAIGRDPSVWENPTRFKPERFIGKETDVKGRDYELTPFGAGRRICPGLPLAMKTVPFMLASLLYSFNWKLPNGVAPEDLDMDETFGLTLHKTNPLLAVPVKKRTTN